MPAARRLPVSGLLILLVLACRPEPSPVIHNETGSRSFTPASSGVTVVHVWATWCPPCVKELPALDRFLRAGLPPGVSMVVVSTQEPLDRSAGFLRERGYVIATEADPGGSFRRYLRARAVPTTVVLAPDGDELHRIVGAAPWEDAAYRARLAELAAKWPADTIR